MPRSGFSRAWRLAACLLGLCLLAACGISIDAEQARVCRSALPALNPGAADHRACACGKARAPRSLRVDYVAEQPDRPALERFAVCQFAAEGLSPNKAELVGLGTEDGPISGASLYLLKRYYLDTPEGVAGDPGSRADADVAEIPGPSPTGCSSFSSACRGRRSMPCSSVAYRPRLRPERADQPGLRRACRRRLGRDGRGASIAARSSGISSPVLGPRGRPRGGALRRRDPQRGRRVFHHRPHHGGKPAAEPDRDRRPVALPDGISARSCRAR